MYEWRIKFWHEWIIVNMQCHSKKESGLGNTSIHIKMTQKLLSVDLRMPPSWEFLYPKTCYSRALKTSDKKEWRHLEMGNEVPREGTAGCWGKRPCWRPRQSWAVSPSPGGNSGGTGRAEQLGSAGKTQKRTSYTEKWLSKLRRVLRQLIIDKRLSVMKLPEAKEGGHLKAQ